MRGSLLSLGLLLCAPALAEPSGRAFVQLETAGAFLAMWPKAPNADPARIQGPALNVEATLGWQVAQEARPYVGATWAIAPEPDEGGHPFQGHVTWGGVGGGLILPLGDDRWLLDMGLFLVEAEALLHHRPDRDTDVNFMPRARFGHRWMLADALGLSVTISARWFYADDDEWERAGAHHLLIAAGLGFAFFDAPSSAR